MAILAQAMATPSARDGMSAAEEDEHRYRGALFVKDRLVPRLLGTRAGARVAGTALCYFQLYFARHSFCRADEFVVGLACVLLACKVHDARQRMHALVDTRRAPRRARARMATRRHARMRA